ncbi:MAG: glycosyltransferase [Nitrospirota bacterium]
MSKQSLSIIIPNYNGVRTIGACLEAFMAFRDDGCEIVVVDDGSYDGSVDVIRRHQVNLVRLSGHAGASAARNAGVSASTGEALFFIDNDCIVTDGTIPRVRKNLSEQPADVVVGGTYTPVPHDTGFFSSFQSAFINYSETKNVHDPDYLATHALVIRAEAFKKAGGFNEDFLPILEDVEFSHRLTRNGFKLIMDPDLQVRHIFHHTFVRSLRNAVKKTRYWTEYSLANRDLFADSGTASAEIKVNGAAWMVTVALALLYLIFGQPSLLAPVPIVSAASMFVNRHLYRAFSKAQGAWFAVKAGAYYSLIYPAAIWTGFFRGMYQYYYKQLKNHYAG